VLQVSSRLFAGARLLSPNEPKVEDFAIARLDLSCGAVARLACSWRLHAGRDAIIEAAFFGSRGGAALRNVNGSFYDFVTERYRGTKTEHLAGPPEPWGGRANVAWTRQLARGNRFDSEIERQLEVAEALDAIYGRAVAIPAGAEQ
jgi:predicted dehydrogenase